MTNTDQTFLLVKKNVNIHALVIEFPNNVLDNREPDAHSDYKHNKQPQGIDIKNDHFFNTDNNISDLQYKIHHTVVH